MKESISIFLVLCEAYQDALQKTLCLFKLFDLSQMSVTMSQIELEKVMDAHLTLHRMSTCCCPDFGREYFEESSA